MHAARTVKRKNFIVGCSSAGGMTLVQWNYSGVAL